MVGFQICFSRLNVCGEEIVLFASPCGLDDDLFTTELDLLLVTATAETDGLAENTDDPRFLFKRFFFRYGKGLCARSHENACA